MNRIVSVSLGSATRDHTAMVKLRGEEYLLERRGTDGDFNAAQRLLTKLDGQVDALGIGGINLYIYGRGSKYKIRDAHRLASTVKETPLVDGNGLKETLERKVLWELQDKYNWNLDHKKVLLTSAVDRLGMAETFEELGCKMHYGDLLFGLNLPLMITRLTTVDRMLKLLGPVISRLPFKLLYPVGKSQEITGNNKYLSYYQWADIIAGDFHLIKKFLPHNLDSKIIITNTVTKFDVKLLKQRGVSLLVTTTPQLAGRSFGTNLLEALLVSLLDTPIDEVTSGDYYRLLSELDLSPRIENLNCQAG
ncbi:MAG: quinate 5-dehydrogenase [Bacillota bacterium]